MKTSRLNLHRLQSVGSQANHTIRYRAVDQKETSQSVRQIDRQTADRPNHRIRTRSNDQTDRKHSFEHWLAVGKPANGANPDTFTCTHLITKDRIDRIVMASVREKKGKHHDHRQQQQLKCCSLRQTVL